MRFYNKKSTREFASATIICGDCRIRLEEVPGRKRRCPRCDLDYGSAELSQIIAEARSKWITGKKQVGYIKTGKPNTNQ